MAVNETLTYYFHPNTMVFPLSSEWYRLFQPLTRRNAIVDLSSLALLSKGSETPWTLDDLLLNHLIVIDATELKLMQHAYCNSDNFSQKNLSQLLKSTLPKDEIGEFLIEAAFFITDRETIVDTSKTHFADQYKGNFYEQIATECLLARQEPQNWWINQKFEPNLALTRQTPYHYIQDKFLESYIPKHMTGKSVIELGCGTGYYTQRIAKHASTVTGIDYNPQYIALANEKRRALDLPINYQVADITDEQFSLHLNQATFDYIVLIDTFLFLFDQKYQPQLFEKRHQIIRNITQIMHKDSVLMIMDPHPFWLTPWVGSQSNPVAILTEYRHRRFKVIPSISEMTSLLNHADLSIKQIHEPEIDSGYEEIDAQAYHFMKEFPQWWVFEAELRGK